MSASQDSGVGGHPLRLQPSAGAGSTLEPRQPLSLWSPDEIEALRRDWPNPHVTRRDLSAQLGRTFRAVGAMARLLGLGHKARADAQTPWTEAEIAYIREHWHITTRHQIAKRLGRTARAVSNFASKHRLGRSEFIVAQTIRRDCSAARQKGRLLYSERLAAGLVRRTPERREILERDWPAGLQVGDICRAMNGLKGPPITKRKVASWAADLRLRRPEGFVATCAPVQMAKKDAAVIKVAAIKRTCLRCQRGFDAAGRFQRLCEPCRRVSEGIA